MKILTLKGKIEVLTGLHIGGSDDTMKIGGVDNSVIKIYDKQLKREVPYIPGSSLKGKIRSLLEWSYGVALLGDGKPFGSSELENEANKEILKEKRKELENFIKLFGDSSSENKFGLTRAIFSDCYLTAEMKKALEEDSIKVREIKTENTIDRVKGTAKHPRQTERVPAGIEFEFEIKIKVLNEDNEVDFKKIIEKGLKLLEMDYLGGNGSRGYGRIKIIKEKDWENETI
jgi:CRISPR-associated protein Csm3